MLGENEVKYTDAQIAQGMAEGDRGAYAEFEKRFSRYIFSRCYAVCRNREEAKDLRNETLIHLLMTIGRYKAEKSALSTWVSNVTRNYLTDYLRDRMEEPTVFPCGHEYLDLVSAKNARVRQDEPDAAVSTLDRVFEKMSARDREIIGMRARGYSYESISGFTGLTAGAAMTAFSRALKRARAVLDLTPGPLS